MHLPIASLNIFRLPWLQRESPGNLPPGRRYKNVMGTDGDLRKLKLSKAKALLRNFGVPEDEVIHGLLIMIALIFKLDAYHNSCLLYRSINCLGGRWSTGLGSCQQKQLGLGTQVSTDR